MGTLLYSPVAWHLEWNVGTSRLILEVTLHYFRVQDFGVAPASTVPDFFLDGLGQVLLPRGSPPHEVMEV